MIQTFRDITGIVFGLLHTSRLRHHVTLEAQEPLAQWQSVISLETMMWWPQISHMISFINHVNSYFIDDMIIIWYMIYLLTAIGLSPGGSSTVHIYTQTIHRTTQITTNLEECGPCPVFASFTLAFASQLRKQHGKTSVSVRKINRCKKAEGNIECGVCNKVRDVIYCIYPSIQWPCI